jgi:hypothetical protein
MFARRRNHESKDLLEISLDAGRLLVDAIVTSPLVPSYFSQIAAHMVEADVKRFRGRYGKALRSAFVKHGVLSLESANGVLESPAGAPRVQATGLTSAPMVPLAGRRYGLAEDLLVPALAETKRFGVAGAGPDVAGVPSLSHDQAARSFVEDLFRRNKVEVIEPEDPERTAHRSHAVRREDDALVLVRTSVDCGFDVFR